MASEVSDQVKDYYGKRLQTSDDLQTTACTTPAQKMPKHIREVMKQIHDEVIAKYYGCGLIVPECLDGMKVLDLGSGSGRDCYALSKLVGEQGFVIGIDMTDEQLAVANKFREYHKTAFGYSKPNVKFVKGYIEKLADAGIEDNSVDIIVSNCVINLCKDKREVLQEAFRVLQDGGELYFSDVYADRELSEKIRSHEVLWGECVSGALHWKKLYELAKEIGFEVPRVVTCSSIDVVRPDLKAVVGDAKFISVVYRLFKLPSNAKQDASQVIYNGGITGFETSIQFDYLTRFNEGTPVTVCGSTAAILKSSRFKNEFMFGKVPCCAQTVETIEEDPFEILTKLGVQKKGNGPSCCSSKCC